MLYVKQESSRTIEDYYKRGQNAVTFAAVIVSYSYLRKLVFGVKCYKLSGYLTVLVFSSFFTMCGKLRRNECVIFFTIFFSYFNSMVSIRIGRKVGRLR